MKSFKQKGLDSPNKIELDAMEREKTSFATMSRNSSGISITFSGSSVDGESQRLSRRGSGKEHSVFGTPVKGYSPSYSEQEDISLQLTAVKLKLEERRRKIEEEKKKMELLMSKQREKVGQEAFLRAVSKGIKKAGSGTREIPDSAREEILELASKVGETSISGGSGSGSAPVKRPFSLKFAEEHSQAAVQTPEMEALDISRMSDSLYSLQSDIQRLALQQTQIQNIMNTAGGTPKYEEGTKKPFYITHSASSSPPCNKPFYMPKPEQTNQPFYVSHSQQSTSPKPSSAPSRRTWGEPQPVHFSSQEPYQPSYTHPQASAQEPFPPFQQPLSHSQQQPLSHPQQMSHLQPQQHMQQPHSSPSPYPNQPPNMYPNQPYSQPYTNQQQFQQNPPPPPSYHFDQFGRPVQWSNQFNQPNQSGFPVNTSNYMGYNAPVYSGYPPQNFNPPHQSPYHNQERYDPEEDTRVPLSRSSSFKRTFSLNRTMPARSLSPDSDLEVPAQDLNMSAPPEPSQSRKNSQYSQYTQVEDRKKPATAEKPSLSASFLQQKRRNAELQEGRPKSSSLEQSERIYATQLSSELRSSPLLRSSSPIPPDDEKEGDSGARETSAEEPRATTFLELSSSPNTHKYARVSPVPPLEPEMTSSTLETLNKMKTENLDETKDAKGFTISFDDASPVKPKPFLKPKKLHRREATLTEDSDCKPQPAAPTDDIDANVNDIDANVNDNDQMTESVPKAAVDSSLPAVVKVPIEKCQLCENDEVGNHNLKLCFQCLKAVRRILGSSDILSCVTGEDACAAGSACDKCLLERGRMLGILDKIREHYQESPQQTFDASAAEKKQEWVQMMTLRRKQQIEEGRTKREEEARRRREEEELRKEELMRKKEEDKKRREEILEQHRIKKEMEKEDKPSCPPSSAKFGPKLRPRSAGGGKPRPKTIHVDSEQDVPVTRSTGLRGSQSNLSMSSLSRNRYHGSLRRGSNVSLHDEDMYAGSLRGLGHIGRSKSSSASNLGPGSLPLGLRHGRGRDFDDGASDISSTTSGYRSGRVSARLYREPQSKSNRPIIMNAVEYVVFPGAVNRDTRLRVLEEIERCDCPHFLLLFRDSRLQFRALYAFYPDTEEVFKIYGTGPKQINDNMMELYYKYNSGGKKFTQIHTKHLTVTIDAFTIHNSLWLGKKTKLPDKKDMPLVI